MLGADWETQTETIAYTLYGWSEGEARRFATLIRESVTAESYQKVVQAINQWDVGDLLPQIQVPTLVMQRRESRLPVLSVARDLAARIPDSRLVLLEGSQPAPYLGDAGAVLDAIEEFLGSPKSEPPARVPGTAFRAVLFTDIVDHTRMMQQLGDERGRELLREHESLTREVLKAHGGTEVKTMGDGFMASFGSVVKAVECAIALQRAFAERNSQLTTHNSQLNVRVGLNAGEPIEEDGDLFGATVILASRIAAKAEGGEILVADTVRGLCSGKGFLFADRGEFVAKGFEEPVRVYEVRWRE
jgi:class 3 adenylate cyclase